MACGLPAIVSDRVGCGPDLVQPGVTGLVFPFGDASRLRATLHGLDAQRLRRMGEAARAWVAEYSVEKAVAGTIAALRTVLEDRR